MTNPNGKILEPPIQIVIYLSTDLNYLFENLNLSTNQNLTTNPTNQLEVTYVNPKAHTWHQSNLENHRRRRLHRRNVPGFRRFKDDSFLLKQNFLAKLDWYKRLNYKRAKIKPKSERLSARRLWNVYSVPSREWMMSGDCKDSVKMQRTRDRSQDFQLSIPIVTNSGNQRWLEVSPREVEDIIRNLKTKSCFRIKHLIFQRNKNYNDED